MTSAVAALVILGIAVAVGLGIAGGFDTTAVIILALMVALGLLAVAVANRARLGKVGPAHCPDCGGVVSPNAPYCKHCGSNLQ